MIDLGLLERNSPEMNIFLWSFFFLAGGLLVTFVSISMILSPKATFWGRMGLLVFSIFAILILMLGLKVMIKSELERREKIHKVIEMLKDS